jgi:hypothetical protein
MAQQFCSDSAWMSSGYRSDITAILHSLRSNFAVVS